MLNPWKNILQGSDPKDGYTMQSIPLKRQELFRRAFYGFYTHKEMTSPALSSFLGVSIPTAGSLITQLEERGIVRFIGEGPSQGGRKPRVFEINKHSYYTLTVNLTRENIRMALFNLRNEKQKTTKFIPLELNDNQAYIEQLVSEIRRFISESGLPGNFLLGIGAAIPGLLDFESGRTYSYFANQSKPLRDILTEGTGLPVFLDNDARLMALGESSFGGAAGKKHALCLIADIGVGLGIIINGRVYRGQKGFAGEFGHTRFVDGESQLCYCGSKGCTELYTSLAALEAMAAGYRRTGSPIWARAEAGEKLKDIIIDEASRGDHLSRLLVGAIGQRIGHSLVNAVHLFDPEIIITGGKFTEAGECFTHSIRETLKAETMERMRNSLQVESSKLGDDAIPLGCHALVMNRMFYDLVPQVFF